MKTINEWVESKEVIELVGMLKSLSHPSRMAIMYLLVNGPEKRMTVKQIYQN